MKIVRLEVSNVKRVKALAITPDPDAPLVVISGENGEGKTSTLDAIAYALGGKKLICDQPLRDGQPSGFADVDLGEIRVRRTWKRGRDGEVSSELEVRSENGTQLRSPQGVLDVIAGKFTFDPLAFSRMEAKKQLEVLRQLVGLDFSEHDQQRKTLFDDRTDVSRELRRLEDRVESMPVHEGVPEAEVSVVELSQEMAKATEANAARARAFDQAEACTRRGGALEEERKRLEQQIVGLQARISQIEVESQAVAVEGWEHEARANGMPTVDLAPIQAQIADAGETNRKVRANAERRRAAEDSRLLRAKHEGMTLRLAALDAEKRAQIEAAKFPVPGLGLGEDGVTYQGLPFEQAAESMRIRVSVAMGIALNPTLKVLLVRDGSGLDRKSEKLLAEMAAEAGVQVWLETTKDGPGYLVIEDGQVVAAA